MQRSFYIRFDLRHLAPILFLLLFVLPSCDSKEPIKIGFVAGVSGRVADLGLSGLDAVQLALKETNENGGVNGRPVQLVIKDDQQNPDIATKVINELIQENVVAIVGPMTSDMGTIAAPILNKAKILNVSPTVTTQALSNKDDYFFRVSATTLEYASRSAHYQINREEMTRIAAIYDLGNKSFSVNWLENFRVPFVKNGGTIVTQVGYEASDKISFFGVAEKALVPGIDGILIIANSMDSAILCQQIRKIDKNIKITLADWGATERLLELGGEAVENVTVVQTFDRDNQNPAYQVFRKKFLTNYKREPGFPGVYAYDAIQVILKALENHKKTESLKETVLRIKHFSGLQGPFSFNKTGDVIRNNASISVIKNQQFVVVE